MIQVISHATAEVMIVGCPRKASPSSDPTCKNKLRQNPPTTIENCFLNLNIYENLWGPWSLKWWQKYWNRRSFKMLVLWAVWWLACDTVVGNYSGSRAPQMLQQVAQNPNLAFHAKICTLYCSLYYLSDSFARASFRQNMTRGAFCRKGEGGSTLQ